MTKDVPRAYRKKPVVVEALRLDRDSAALAERWCGGRIVYTPAGKQSGIDIATLEGVMHASFGDYIIMGTEGEFYPCKPGIFEATYEACK